MTKRPVSKFDPLGLPIIDPNSDPNRKLSRAEILENMKEQILKEYNQPNCNYEECFSQQQFSAVAQEFNDRKEVALKRLQDYPMDNEAREHIRARIDLFFSSLPELGRAIFMAPEH